MTPDHALRERVALAMGWEETPILRHWIGPQRQCCTRLPAYELDRWPDVLAWLTGEGWSYMLQGKGAGVACWLTHDDNDDGGSLHPIMGEGPTPGLAVCRAVAGMTPNGVQ